MQYSKLPKMRKVRSQTHLLKFQDIQSKSNLVHSISEKPLQSNTGSTKISYFSRNQNEITILIQERRFTEIMEYLENLGYAGDAALFVLANLQVFGGAA